MKAIGRILRARWFWTLLGALVLALLVWFFGDLVAVAGVRPLGDPLVRGLVAAAIVLLAGIGVLVAMLLARRRNDRLVEALAAPAATPDAGKSEVAELARRFAGALEQLKRSKLGARGNRRWLYELPWYVMIGPPGSGKTTALAQSGLRFPLGQAQDLRGTGGTRYCDWVFTDEAVLIDTAGRYTTQDSDADTDKTAWQGFLDLLKRHRPRQPLNGVLVAVSVKELLDPHAGGVDHAARIRQRLEELEQRLGVRLPVYLIVTKTDLLAGFTGFFDDLGEQDREQVWGYTFAHTPGAADQLDPAELRQGIRDLVGRLDRRLPRRLAEEGDVERRAQIFGFPARVAELGEELARFVERCFPPTTYEKGAWLRGVYLTSGTQTGTPIDRLLAAISASVGMPASPPLALTGDRSFFLTRLLKEVVFGEASLVGRDLGRERRGRLVRTASIAGLAAVSLLLLGGWTWSFLQNRARQFELERQLVAWAQDSAPVARDRLLPGDWDYAAVLPALDRLAAIKAPLAAADPLPMQLGLSQRATAERRLEGAYRAALVDLLLPRLVLSLERDLRARLADPEYVIEGLKTYLMLGGGAPADPAQIEAWFALDAESRAPQYLESAKRHTAALAAILPRVDQRPTLDARLLADAQAVLDRVPLPKRAYEALVTSPEVRGLPGWKVTDNAGPQATTTLVRRSGQPLGTEIPAIYTHAGFHEVFLPLLDGAARAAYAEAWVLAGRGTPDPSDAEIERLKDDMLRLYYDDAIAAWDGLLRDVTLAPMRSLDQAVEVTRALSGPSSPLKLFVQAVVRETALTVPPTPEGGAAGAASAARDAAQKAADKAITQRLGKLAALVRPGATQAAPAVVPGAAVEAHFAYLREAVEGVGGAPPAMDEAITALGSLHAKLNEAALSPNPGAAFAAVTGGAAAALKQAAARLPGPIAQALTDVAQTAERQSSAGIKEKLNAAWRADILPFCRTAIGGRFPFTRGSSVDASLDDVVRLLGPNGMIDSFVKTELAPFVDTGRQPWRDTQNVGFSAAALGQLARARKITSALFAGGGAPRASFNLTPLSLDANAASVSLDVDGQEVRYAHGPARPTPITWPGPGGTATTRLSFAPVGGGPPVTVLKEGSWSLFRLLHEAEFQRMGQPDLFEITLRSGGYAARFRLRASSVDNPFDLAVLTGFGCPDQL